MGNRGILHDETKRICKSPTTTSWLICRLEFNNRKQELLRPGHYTQLFFLFVQLGEDDFRLIWDCALHRWTPGAYVDPIASAGAGVSEVRVMKPSLSVAALRGGYPGGGAPVRHPIAQESNCFASKCLKREFRSSDVCVHGY
jgi:hypothetical protein